MSWRDEYEAEPWEEAEREMQRARDEDRNRTRGPTAAVALFALSGRGPTRCHRCGHEAEGPGFDMASDGSGRVLCAWRVDETGKRIDCYDAADRENAERLGQQVDRVREIVREVKKANALGEYDKRYLLSVGLRDTVEALEKRIQEHEERAASSVRGRKDRDL